MAATSDQAYLWGSLTTLVVCVLSLGGVLIYPLIRKGDGRRQQRTRSRWMMALVALAVATMSTDALLHLVPEALGLHGHHAEGGDHKELAHNNHSSTEEAHHSEEAHADHEHRKRRQAVDESHEDKHHDDDSHEEHGGEHHDEVDERQKGRIVLFKMSAIVLVVYVLYVFEFVSENRKRNKGGDGPAHPHHHSHSQGNGPKKRESLQITHHPHMGNATVAPMADYYYYVQPTHPHFTSTDQQPQSVQGIRYISRNGSTDQILAVPSQTPLVTPNGAVTEGHNGTSEASGSQLEEIKEHTSLEQEQHPLCCGLRPIAITITLGDAIHNLCDGLAMGAAFSASVSSGVATAIAVACHELPHEIGDFAVLIDSGLPVWKALMLNFLSALTAFIGLYIGLAVGGDENVRQWLFVITAGIFLYVGWVDMLAFLKMEESFDPWYVCLALQNLGFVIGFVLIFLLGWFEHDIVELLENGTHGH